MSTLDDNPVVEAQLGRELRSQAEVQTRCHLELPVTIGVAPILDDGTPFPTRWWLTCPLARLRIDRLESAGGVAAMDRQLAANPAWRQRLDQANARYAAERDALVPANAANRPSGGVAGTTGEGVKCLHAHYADHANGNDNPVGEATAAFVEPLNCSQPCVVAGSRNDEWVEPK